MDMYKPCPEEPIRGVARVIHWKENESCLARHGLLHGRVFARVTHCHVVSSHGHCHVVTHCHVVIWPCLESQARVLINFVRVLPLECPMT